MVKIHKIFVGNSLRNFTYVVELNNQNCFCIDPTRADLVEEYIEKNNLNLVGIINTHEHFDHVGGNQELVSKYRCHVYCHKKAIDKVPCASIGIDDGEKISLDNNNYFETLSTPGHTYGHICLVLYQTTPNSSPSPNSSLPTSPSPVPTALLSGDTLFNSGVGNCSGGDVESMYESVTNKLSKLPDTVKLYPGHDYIEKNLNFAKYVENDNIEIEKYLKIYEEKGVDLVLTMQDERKYNPFFRLYSSSIVENLKERGLRCDNEKEVFISLRKIRDNF